MEQLIILLLIALISLINWLVQKSSEMRKARKKEQGSATRAESLRGGPPPPPEPEREVSMRRFREALGLPEETPPPAIPKRKEQPLPPPLPVPPPPRAPSPATTAAHVPVVTPPIVRAHTAHRLPHKIGKPAGRAIEPEAKASRIRELLDSSGGLRDAVVLSEILGVPKGLRKEEEQLLK
jgi:hypothetical protein